MNKELEIKGRDVLRVKTISKGKNYDVAEDHSFFGKTFNTYQFNGIVFTVDSKDEFVDWKDNGRLYSITFIPGERKKEVDGTMVSVPTLQLASCTNVDQEISMAQTEKTLQDIFKDEPALPVNAAVLNGVV